MKMKIERTSEKIVKKCLKSDAVYNVYDFENGEMQDLMLSRFKIQELHKMDKTSDYKEMRKVLGIIKILGENADCFGAGFNLEFSSDCTYSIGSQLEEIYKNLDEYKEHVEGLKNKISKITLEF